MFRKAAPKNKNTFRKHSRVILNKSNNSATRKVLSNVLLVVLIVLSVIGGVFGIYRGVVWMIDSAYKPGIDKFSDCSQQFTLIKASPMYGVIFTTNEESVEKISITAPDGLKLNALELQGNSWVMVYFSNHFTFSQVAELVRFSKLEKNKVDYCYLLEQISLTTGVPVEYVIVNDKNDGISSTLPLREIRRITKQVADSEKKLFKERILPQYLLSDGSTVQVVTYSAMKEQFPNFFKIPEISQEQAFVEVYNVTSIDGYASIISRKWSMLGIEISRVGNASHEQIEGAVAVVYVKSPGEYQRTLSMIKSSLIGGKVVVREGRPSNVVTTGDVVVFLLKR